MKGLVHSAILVVLSAGLLHSQEPPGVSLEQLVGQLGNDQPDVRNKALAGILGRWEVWKDQELEVLEKSTRDPDAELAKRAMEALSRIRIRRRAGRQILENIKDIDAAIYLGGEEDRLWALKELGRLAGKQALDPKAVAGVLDLAGAPQLQSKAAELIAFVEDLHLTSFAPLLVPYLTDDRGEVRRSALWALGWIGATQYAPRIAERVGLDPYAAGALGILGATEYAGPIKALLQHGSQDFRMAAMAGLMELGAPIPTDDVLLLLKHEDALTRGLAALTLTVVGGPEQLKQLPLLLKDPDASVRGNAVWALYFLGAKEYFGEVRSLLRDPEEPVRGAASVFVARFSETLSDLAKDGLSREIQEACPKNGTEQWIASIYLGNAPPRNLRRFLLEIAKPESAGWRKLGICLLDALGRTLEPAGYRKLSQRGRLPRPIDSMDDLRAYFRGLGLEFETLGQASMGGRMNAGVVMDGRTLIANRFRLQTYGYVLHRDRVVLMPWEEAMREWIRKIDRE